MCSKIHRRDSDINVYIWPVLFCNQPDYCSHTDLSPSLQNHKPHNTDLMVSINCLEIIFEISKCDLTKIKSSIQQLHQNAAFVIISLGFIGCICRKARNKFNSTRVTGIQCCLGDIESTNWWMVYFFFWGIFLKARLFSVSMLGKWEILPWQRKETDYQTWKGKLRVKDWAMLSYVPDHQGFGVKTDLELNWEVKVEIQIPEWLRYM